MSHPSVRQIALVGAVGGAGLLAVYLRLVRPWTMRWGATDEEVARPLSGDRLMTRPGFKATRAITIGAHPEHIWPWLVQLGSGRAGWYAIDRIDNAGIPSAQTVRPELQNLQVGDRIPMIAGEEVGPVVKELEPNRRMLWWDGKGEFTWEWLLEPVDDQTTRLLTRVQETYPPLWSRRMLYAIVASSGDIVMVRRQLRGIKARAERLAVASPDPGHPATPTRAEAPA
ncbi:MAG TPA: hypothetical protein VFN05_12660 [Actinomycetes bacterium]|nr:hypothetical protein [Actinomycetes bacterium]